MCHEAARGRHNASKRLLKENFTRFGIFTLNYIFKMCIPVLFLEAKAESLAFGFSCKFYPTQFCFTVLFRGCCPIAFVSEVLPKVVHRKKTSLVFFHMKSCLTDCASTIPAPAFFSHKWYSPKLRSLLFIAAPLLHLVPRSGPSP